MFDLAKALFDAMKPRETREDVIDYFKEKYPGQKTNKKGAVTYEWHRKLAEEMQPFARGAKGQGMSIPNLMRRFQKRGGVDPLSKAPSHKQEAEYRALGDTLPRMIPEGGFAITGTICVHYKDGPCEERELDGDTTVYLTGEEAKRFVETPDLQALVNIYMETGYDGPEVGGPALDACPGDEDCQPDLNIEPIE